MKCNFVALDVVKSVNPYQKAIKPGQSHYKGRTEGFSLRGLYNDFDPNCKIQTVLLPMSIK